MNLEDDVANGITSMTYTWVHCTLILNLKRLRQGVLVMNFEVVSDSISSECFVFTFRATEGLESQVVSVEMIVEIPFI